MLGCFPLGHGHKPHFTGSSSLSVLGSSRAPIVGPGSTGSSTGASLHRLFASTVFQYEITSYPLPCLSPSPPTQQLRKTRRRRLSLQPRWRSCAREGGECFCTGTVVYGQQRRYPSGKRRGNPRATIDEIRAAGFHVEKQVTGSIKCSNAVMGSDPLPGVPKQCLCGPPIAFSGYVRSNNEDCGGTPIDLDDNTPTPWSPPSGSITECEDRCRQSSHCSAFVWSSGSCSWRNGTVRDGYHFKAESACLAKPGSKGGIIMMGNIQSKDGLCLDAPNLGGVVQLWACDTRRSQQWIYDGPSGLIKLQSGLGCLASTQRNKRDGRVSLESCDSNKKITQQWIFSSTSLQIKAQYGMCLQSSKQGEMEEKHLTSGPVYPTIAT